MIGRAFEHPAEIVAIVGREPKLGIVSHDTGQRVQGLARHEAAPLMPALWPRVGKEDEDTIDRGRRQCRDQEARIVGKDPYVAELSALDFYEQSGNPVLENLAADQAGLRVALGLIGQVLATAKADLEPNRSSHRPERSPRLQPSRWRKAQGEP